MREYERAKKEFGSYMSVYQKNLYNNLSEAEKKIRIQKHTESMLNRTPEEKFATKQKELQTKANRTEEQTLQVKAFCEWFGSTETQTQWANEFDRYPCNTEAAAASDLVDYAGIYSLHNMAQDKVGDKLYYEYVAEHSSEWTNIMTNLGFYWADMSKPNAEPDWANLDWATLCKAAK